MKRLLHVLGAGLLASLLIGFHSTSAQPAATDKNTAKVKITVPADAVVEFNGEKTKLTGPVRQFVTPPLEPGKQFSYLVKVSYWKKGDTKPIEVEKKLTVEAGKDVSLDFTPEEKKEPAKEAPKEAPKQVTVNETPKEEKKKEETIVVPYVPTPQTVVDEMLKLAGVKEGDVVYDLGCGDGRIVVTAVKDFKAKEGWGVDLNPERVKDSMENAKKNGVADKVKFEQGDVLKIEDVSKANVVTLYLLPRVNLLLAPMLKKTLKPGSRIVSHDFDMGDWKADKELTVKDPDGRAHTIYLWTIPVPQAKQPELKKPLAQNQKRVDSNTFVSLLEEPKKADEPSSIFVPFVPTPQKVVEAMLKLADVKEGDVVYDLGCGDGRIVVTAVKDFKAKEGWGLDIHEARVKDSIETAKKAGVSDKVRFEQGDVLKVKDVSKASVVTLYLLPEVNLRLAPMLKKTLKPGSRVVSHDFDMGDWKADKEIKVKDDNDVTHTVYLWTIPENKTK